MNDRRFRFATLVTLNISATLVVLLGVAIMLSWTSPPVSANTVTPELSIDGAGLNCDTNPNTPAGSTCYVPVGSMFKIEANVDKIAGLIDGDGDTNAEYMGFQVRLTQDAALVNQNLPGTAELGPFAAPFWPDCANRVQFKASATDYRVGCLIDLGNGFGSTYTGKVAEESYNCTQHGTYSVTMLNGGDPNSHVLNEFNQEVPDDTEIDALTIQCERVGMSLAVDVDGGGDDCDTNATTLTASACNVPVGSQFTVRASLDYFSGLLDTDGDTVAGYNGVQVRLLQPAAITRKNRSLQTELGPFGTPFWPDCFIRAEFEASATDYQVGCYIDPFPPNGFGSTYTGKLAEVDYNCTTVGQFTVTKPNGGPPNSHITDENNNPAPEVNPSDVLTINCVPPDRDINITVADSVSAALVPSSCFQIAALIPPSPPQQLDVVGDNGLSCTGGQGVFVDHDPAIGTLSITIPGITRLQYGDAWHATQTQAPPEYHIDQVKHFCDLSSNCSLSIVNVPKAKDVANALGVLDPQLQAASFNGSDLQGIAIQTATLGKWPFPTEGTSFAILSTGIASDATLPDTTGSHSTVLGGINSSQGNDLVQLDLTLVAPATATCLRFDWAFASEEYPEYVGSVHNDGVVAEIGGASFVIIGNQIVSPFNILSDPTDGSVMDVSSSLAFHRGTGTTYDGATDLLGATKPVIPGQKARIVFSVMDVGDSMFDSALLLDNFRWTQETGTDCPSGLDVPQPIFTVHGANALQGSKAWIRQGSSVQWDCNPNDPADDVILRFQYTWGTVDFAGTGQTTFTHRPPADQLLAVACLVNDVQIGNIVITWIDLVDPSGRVFDIQTGLSVPEATVTLQVQVAPGVFQPVPLDPLLKDPVVNPQITGLDGRYAWLVAAGTYRVRVDKITCSSATSPVVSVPPPVTGLDVGIDCADTDEDGLPDFFEPNTNTSPVDSDSDNDGTPDGAEDADADGLTNLQEIALGTDPLTADSVDSDRDGCTNMQEFGSDQTHGGRRDAAHVWDFMDQYTGSPLVRDRVVAVGDIGAVVARFGRSGAPSGDPLIPPSGLTGYHTSADRNGSIPGLNPWNLLPADGHIAIGDVGAVVAQFGHSCLP